jgi:threonine dehydrogenase-like Zn-dependent dehydrogenase
VNTKKIDIKDMATHTFSIDDYETMIETNLAKAKNRVVKTMVSFR